jgi:protein TonB
MDSTGQLEIVETQQEVVLVEEVEQTHQAEKPPPPPKAPPPVEVANEAIVEDVVLDFDMDLDLGEVVTPPPPPPPAAEPEPEAAPEEEPEIFVVVEEPPQLIGGLESLQSRIQYPELARMAEIQGTVFVQFVVDENGNVNDPVCVRDPGGGTCEEALRAVREVKFRPGRQRGKPVKVRFSLPVKFRLR